MTNQQQDCQRPCNSLVVSLSAKNYKKTNQSFGEVYLYFPARVRKSEEHYFYSFVSLMGEIGGLVGLLLGFSFWQIAEVISTLIQQKIKWYERKLETDIEASQ